MIPLSNPILRKQLGLGAIAAIAVLVVLSALAAALMKFSVVQQTVLAQDVLATRAWSAARAGNEWGLYRTLQGAWAGAACANVTQTLDLSAQTGFWVTVTCTSQVYNEGESVPGTPQTVRIYVIQATACNIPTTAPSCPNNAAAASQGYVERVRQVMATD